MERNIHQIWMQGRDKVPAKLSVYMAQNASMHPAWNYEFWDEPRIERLVAGNDRWRDKYATFGFLHQRVDFAKLLILYTYGGIVIDADAYTVRPLDALFDEHKDADFVASLLFRSPPPLGWLQSWIACKTSGSCVNNGSYAGKRGSHALRYMIDHIVSLPVCTNRSREDCIQQTTGPVVFSRMVREYARNHGKAVILEHDSLEPCIGTTCNFTDRTYIVHKHEMTWCGPMMRELARFYMTYPTTSYVIVVSTCLIIIFVVTLILYKVIHKARMVARESRTPTRR